MPGIVHLHRVLRAPPERVYKAFLDAGAIARWLPPYGFICTVHQLDAKVGGLHKMSFTNFSTGHVQSFGGEYRQLEPGKSIQYTDSFDDPKLRGQLLTTVSLKQVSCGTEIDIEQAGVPDGIPVELCYLGWQESLMQLARLVEAQMPD